MMTPLPNRIALHPNQAEASWGAATRRTRLAWGDHTSAEGPLRGASCAPWGGSASCAPWAAATPRTRLAWGDHIHDRAHQQVEVDGLGNDSVETRVHRARPILVAGVSSARDRRRASAFVRRKIANAADQLVTVLSRHADVRDHQIGMPDDEGLPGLARGRRCAHARAARLERFGEKRPRRRIVVDNQKLQLRLR